MCSRSLADILLVDDDDVDAELTLRTLHRGHVLNSVIRMRDGVEALHYIFGEGVFVGRKREQPGLILLDLKMPRAGGLDVLQTLKSDASTKDIPVLVLSSSREDASVEDTHRMGSVAYLRKPLSLMSFMEALAKAGLNNCVMRRT